MSPYNETTEGMIGYYSYLFTFPSRNVMIVLVTLFSILGGSITFAISQGQTFIREGLIFGSCLAFAFLAPDQLFKILFSKDHFLEPRRFTILSYFSSIIIVGLLLLSAIVGQQATSKEILLKGFLF